MKRKKLLALPFFVVLATVGQQTAARDGVLACISHHGS